MAIRKQYPLSTRLRYSLFYLCECRDDRIVVNKNYKVKLMSIIVGPKCSHIMNDIREEIQFLLTRKAHKPGLGELERE